jgi:hypothetical protein
MFPDSSAPPSISPIPSPNIKVVSSNHSSSPLKVVLFVTLGLLLVGGIATAVILIQNRQLLSTKALDCSLYKFSISKTGQVTATNNSSTDEPTQKVNISIDGSPVALLDIPALTAGDSVTIGTVSVPLSGTFTWDATGTVDCANHGSYTAPTPFATPLPTSAPSSTPTPTLTLGTGGSEEATPTPTSQPNSCNGTCSSDNNCQYGLYCYQGHCRNATCPGNSTCDCALPTDIPVATAAPTPSALAQTGAAGFTWIIAAGSLLLIGAGALLAF